MKRRDFVKSASAGLAAAVLQIDWKHKYVRSSGGLKHEQIIPKALFPDCNIALVSPAGATFTADEVENAAKEIQKAGYRAVPMPNVNARQGQFAGTDQQRADDLHEAFRRTDIHGIVAVRGGSGCARMLHLLDVELIKNNPKAVVGFSDITVLLQYITLKTGLITFHGPVGYSTWNEYSVTALRNIIEKGNTEIPHGGTASSGFEPVTGVLWGGNLRVFTHTLGTTFEPEDNDMILFLEEVEEEPYSIDRAFQHVLQWKNFERVRAIILGGFTKCVPEKPERSLTLEQTLNEFIAKAKVPVVSGTKIGHLRDKLTVPLGVGITLDKTKIDCQSPCVKI